MDSDCPDSSGGRTVYSRCPFLADRESLPARSRDTGAGK